MHLGQLFMFVPHEKGSCSTKVSGEVIPVCSRVMRFALLLASQV